MGVADNKTYKDQYHFSQRYFGVDKEHFPSIVVDPKINSTIKENPHRANVEIEKDEVVLKPDLTALFKANGKTHKNGGVEVNLEPSSFIFSNDPSLAIGQINHELFGLKTKNNKFSKADNTPAEVLRRNVDLEHYNKMVVNLEDPYKDDIAKKSSQMMLQKYIGTLGRIAFLQEQKKGFPDGVPPFAADTAPVYDKQLKDDIDSQKQYMKYGGSVDAPYLSIFAGGGRVNNNGDKTGRYSGIARTDTPSTVYMPPQAGLPLPKAPDLKPCAGGYMDTTTLKWVCPETVASDIPHPTAVPAGGQEALRADWEFTPWQKVSQLYNFSKYAGAKRYMPMRSQINPSYVDAQLVNPEQAIGDLRAGMNTQTRALNTLNPILRNAQGASMYGQYLNQVPQVRSQYDNQNVQITNQNRAMNNQIRNNAGQTNTQLDQQYYQQSVQGRQNFDNMKTYLGDQWMNNVMSDVQDNQSLAYNMLTQNNPAYRYDFRTGQFVRNPKNILDAQTPDNTREDILSLAESLKRRGYTDALISNIIKSKVFQTSQMTQLPREYRSQ